jgi:hypothetical protein
MFALKYISNIFIQILINKNNKKYIVIKTGRNLDFFYFTRFKLIFAYLNLVFLFLVIFEI